MHLKFGGLLRGHAAFVPCKRIQIDARSWSDHDGTRDDRRDAARASGIRRQLEFVRAHVGLRLAFLHGAGKRKWFIAGNGASFEQTHGGTGLKPRAVFAAIKIRRRKRDDGFAAPVSTSSQLRYDRM